MVSDPFRWLPTATSREASMASDLNLHQLHLLWVASLGDGSFNSLDYQILGRDRRCSACLPTA
jgi:hypothetical protein